MINDAATRTADQPIIRDQWGFGAKSASRRRDWAQWTSGDQVSWGVRKARRSSTHFEESGAVPAVLPSALLFANLLLLSIAAYILLSERFVCASEQRAERCGMNIKCGGQLAVTEVVTSQQKQLRLPRGKRCEYAADAFLFFGGGVKLFGSWDTPNDRKQALIAIAPRLPAQFVEAEPDCSAIEPRFSVRSVSARRPPKPNKRFDGEFFSPCWVANDPGDHSRDTIESSAEERLDVESHVGRGCRFEGDVTGCVHIHITTQSLYL
jgi:hypothetical protein